MWVKLRSIQQVEQAGVVRTFRPGDWVEVGKQQAGVWIERGDAYVPDENEVLVEPRTLRGSRRSKVEEAFGDPGVRR